MYVCLICVCDSDIYHAFTHTPDDVFLVFFRGGPLLHNKHYNCFSFVIFGARNESSIDEITRIAKQAAAAAAGLFASYSGGKFSFISNDVYEVCLYCFQFLLLLPNVFCDNL